MKLDFQSVQVRSSLLLWIVTGCWLFDYAQFMHWKEVIDFVLFFWWIVMLLFWLTQLPEEDPWRWVRQPEYAFWSGIVWGKVWFTPEFPMLANCCWWIGFFGTAFFLIRYMRRWYKQYKQEISS